MIPRTMLLKELLLAGRHRFHFVLECAMQLLESLGVESLSVTRSVDKLLMSQAFK